MSLQLSPFQRGCPLERQALLLAAHLFLYLPELRVELLFRETKRLGFEGFESSFKKRIA